MPNKNYNYIRKVISYNGHRYEVYGKTEAEANRKAGKKLAELERGDIGISGSMTVKRWCETFVAAYVTPRIRPAGAPKKDKTSLTKKSAGMYSEKIDGYILPAIGGLRLREVTAAHLQQILNDQSGTSFSSVKKLTGVIQQIFSRAYVERLIPFDPSRGLTLPFVEKKTRRSLTPAEEKVLHAVAATHPYGLWIEFHLGFGVRPSEVPPLLVKDLDFKNHRLHVSQALESGSKAIKDPKTTAGIRDIPIPPKLERHLKAYVAKKDPFDYLFPNANGDMMDISCIRRRWKSFRRAMDIHMGAELTPKGAIKPETSKVAEDLTLYCLRHTFCTKLGEAGVDASIGRFVTGHKDVATLANVYMHSNDTVIQFIEDKLYPKPDAKKKKKEAAQ